MSIINHTTILSAITQRCLKFPILAVPLLAMPLACGGDGGDPISAAQFCEEATPKFRQIRDQFDSVVTTANTLNTLNAITVTRSIKNESERLNTLSKEAHAISTNITVPESEQETFDELAETYRDHTNEMVMDSGVMGYLMDKYSKEGDPDRLDGFVQRVKWFQNETDLAELVVFAACLQAGQPNSG